MRIEQRQLLLSVHPVQRVVDVEDDLLRCPPIAVAEQIHQRPLQPGQLNPAGRVLQPRHGRLRAQRIATLRGMAHRHLEHRIVAQLVAIVGVLIARRDREHPQPQHLRQRMNDPQWIAPVRHAFRKPPRQSQTPLNTTQQQHPRVRRHLTAIESHAHFLARDRWQIEGEDGILFHDGCGAPRSLA